MIPCTFFFFQIEIEAEGGSGFAGDIAIDEVLMTMGECENRQGKKIANKIIILFI